MYLVLITPGDSLWMSVGGTYASKEEAGLKAVELSHERTASTMVVEIVAEHVLMRESFMGESE